MPKKIKSKYCWESDMTAHKKCRFAMCQCPCHKPKSTKQGEDKVMSTTKPRSPDYHAGYQEGFSEGIKHAQKFIESQSTPSPIVIENLIPAPATTQGQHTPHAQHRREGIERCCVEEIRERRAQADKDAVRLMGLDHNRPKWMDVDYLLSSRDKLVAALRYLRPHVAVQDIAVVDAALAEVQDVI